MCFCSCATSKSLCRPWFPPLGLCKLNFMAPLLVIQGRQVLGVFKGIISQIICVICGPLGICDSTKAEVFALVMGL